MVSRPGLSLLTVLCSACCQLILPEDNLLVIQPVDVQICLNLVRIIQESDFLLKGRLDLQTALQIVESCVFQATVAHKVVQLMSRLNNIQIQSIVKRTHVFLFQNSNVPVDIQVPQMLLPLFETDYAHDLL